MVHLDQPDQTIEGFGINDMYQGSALPASLFDPNSGIGLSILRVGMDTNGQGNLQSATSMKADMATVNAAGGKVIGSVWTPPANCKTNQNGNNGGQLCSANNISIPSRGSEPVHVQREQHLLQLVGDDDNELRDGQSPVRDVVAERARVRLVRQQ